MITEERFEQLWTIVQNLPPDQHPCHEAYEVRQDWDRKSPLFHSAALFVARTLKEHLTPDEWEFVVGPHLNLRVEFAPHTLTRKHQESALNDGCAELMLQYAIGYISHDVLVRCVEIHPEAALQYARMRMNVTQTREAMRVVRLPARLMFAGDLVSDREIKEAADNLSSHLLSARCKPRLSPEQWGRIVRARAYEAIRVADLLSDEDLWWCAQQHPQIAFQSGASKRLSVDQIAQIATQCPLWALENESDRLPLDVLIACAREYPNTGLCFAAARLPTRVVIECAIKEPSTALESKAHERLPVEVLDAIVLGSFEHDTGVTITAAILGDAWRRLSDEGFREFCQRMPGYIAKETKDGLFRGRAVDPDILAECIKSNQGTP